ncbi:tyrosine-type recombinase/integrase [Fictibacillus gelatini]|uniref:tyrosine-type recombinase/integrase n=1 Tax=Fictibacillus gelatini TaxID=225985 RepID=UPI000419AB64|nr:tyrosine-type recombinase/integrase [Fictibacillus gelatini]
MSNVIPLHQSKPLIEEYKAYISGKSAKTIDAYIRSIHQLTEWISAKPGSAGKFQPEQFTKTAMEMYLSYLEDEGYSINHRNRIKSAASSFARWLIEEKGLLQQNPTRGVDIPPQPLLAPRELSKDQRYVLRNLVEREGDLRGKAIFALGYWAGLRISDVSWLMVKDTYIGPKIGWLRVGYKGGKRREIDLLNQVRRPLSNYLEHGKRIKDSPYVFTSQRCEQLTEAGIHHWFRKLKSLATKDEWDLIHDVTFHHLRHDFAHRARESGWTIEEIAYYLGHVTKKGTPAIATTARYTQVSRKQIKEKLYQIKG